MKYLYQHDEVKYPLLLPVLIGLFYKDPNEVIPHRLKGSSCMLKGNALIGGLYMTCHILNRGKR
jgi:hypothetical protein